MIEKDTIRLLRECDSGSKMGIASIQEVIDVVRNKELYQALFQCREEHELIQDDLQKLLEQYHDDGKEPNPMAKGMSWLKTNAKLIAEPNDSTVADLMTDGCNMGIKSLTKYLHQYAAADEKSKALTKRLIHSEEKLVTAMRAYL